MSAGTQRAGIAWLIAATCLFATVDGLSKVLVAEQSYGQIMLARYTLSLPVLLLVAPRGAWRSVFRTGSPGTQITRGLMPVLIGSLMVISVMFMPLAEATVILFAGPFLVLAMSGMLVGERVPASSWIGVAIGFLAVLVVARPGLEGLTYHAILPAMAAFFYALLQLYSRKLGTIGDSAATSLAWTLLVGLILAIPFAVYDWRPVAPSAWVVLVLLGLTFGGAQYTLARAYALAPANLLAPYSYTQVMAATIFGVAVFHDIPDLWTTIGILMICGAGVYVFGSGRRAAGS